MKSKIVFITIFLLFAWVESQAQCAMCRAVLESEEGQQTAKGINDGILYLMIIPYVLIGAVGYFIFRNKKKTRARTQ